MRITFKFVALGAALIASPALAQLNVGGGAGAGLGVGGGINAGGAIGGVTGTLGRTVNGADRTVNGTLNGTTELQAATSADLTSGAVIRDQRGDSVGTVQSVSGGTAVIARSGRAFNVPLSSLYKSGSGLVTNLSRSQLKAAAAANASADAQASTPRR